MIRSALAVLLSVLMTGCIHLGTGKMFTANEVWRPVWLVGENPGEGEDAPYLRLVEGQVEGYGGCNRIVGEYRLGDRIKKFPRSQPRCWFGSGRHQEVAGEIEFSRLASTRRACISGMEREDAFLKALENARFWTRQEDSLSLYDGEEELLLQMKTVKNPE